MIRYSTRLSKGRVTAARGVQTTGQTLVSPTLSILHHKTRLSLVKKPLGALSSVAYYLDYPPAASIPHPTSHTAQCQSSLNYRASQFQVGPDTFHHSLFPPSPTKHHPIRTMVVVPDPERSPSVSVLSIITHPIAHNRRTDGRTTGWSDLLCTVLQSNTPSLVPSSSPISPPLVSLSYRAALPRLMRRRALVLFFFSLDMY